MYCTIDVENLARCVVVNACMSAVSIACKFADVKPLNCVEVSEDT